MQHQDNDIGVLAGSEAANAEEWTVDMQVAATGSYISRAHKLAPLCSLIFKHSSAQHPLVAGALGTNTPQPIDLRSTVNQPEDVSVLIAVQIIAIFS